MKRSIHVLLFGCVCASGVWLSEESARAQFGYNPYAQLQAFQQSAYQQRLLNNVTAKTYSQLTPHQRAVLATGQTMNSQIYQAYVSGYANNPVNYWTGNPGAY